MGVVALYTQKEFFENGVKQNVEDIRSAMRSLGTYKPEFEFRIRRMAENMEARKKALNAWKKGEGTLKDYKDLDARYLDYMKELSLTHQALKRRRSAERTVSTKPTLSEAIGRLTED